MIKTVSVSGITAVNFNADNKDPYFYLSEKYVWIRNKSGSAVYVSADGNCVPGADGTAEIPSGESVRTELTSTNILYFSGNGDIELHTSDNAVCGSYGGGSGGGGSAVLVTKTVTANGVYPASADEADGYSSVTVNVSPDVYCGKAPPESSLGNDGDIFIQYIGG